MMTTGAAAHLSHFIRMTSSNRLALDQCWTLLEYALEAGRIGLLSKRFGASKRGRRQSVGERMAKLGGAISTARVLYRLFDTLTMIDWLNGLYATPSAEEGAAPSVNPSLTLLEKGQAWSLLLCAPLEAIFYLCLIGSLKFKAARRDFIGMWSARFWSLSIVFQLLYTLRGRQLLKQEQRSFLTATAPLVKASATSESEAPAPLSSASSDSGVGLSTDEVKPDDGKLSEMLPVEVLGLSIDFEQKMSEFAVRRKNLRDGLLESLGIFPLTLHWSMGETLFPDGSAYVGILGTLSALSGLRKSWRESA